MPILNDVQSQLNATRVARAVAPSSADEVAAVIGEAAALGVPVCPAGALHAMGGQQFAEGGISLNSSALAGIGALDRDAATVWIQAGARWTEIVEWLRREQAGERRPLTIIQKQTGADALTIGGALSANAHGRVLGRKPIVDDIAAFRITGADGARRLCDRAENADLFRAAIGGYGMFGFVDSVLLRLEPKTALIRRVREVRTEDAVNALIERTARGDAYGDFQYMTDEADDDFMRKGILSTYSRADGATEIPDGQLGLSLEDWTRLYFLAHADKARAYAEYAAHYLRTDGQLYWSDEHQLSPYLPEAGDMLARRMGWTPHRSLMITELYVPRAAFPRFMESARAAMLETGANVVYGTVRLIEAERETVLRWASQDWACVIFNLLVEHSPNGVERAKTQFRALIDRALDEGGRYYLTYHRWARRDQLERAYPEMGSFLTLKDRHDPRGVFDSEWLRAIRAQLAG